VWLRCRTDREHLVLEVEDQGAGVAPGNRERIFDPFFTTKAPGHGTGLGLSIAHRVVEGHGGRISVADAPGGGAVFRVQLPLAQAAGA
jgi:signal transduction histidine kinase